MSGPHSIRQLVPSDAETFRALHLEALQAEARAKGYGLIVRKAAAALGAKPESRTAAGNP